MLELNVLLNNAIASHQVGDFAAAATGYATILTQDPKHADAWHLAGLLAHQNGRSAEGLNQIQMAIELNPTNAEYHSNLAVILGCLDLSQQALEAANRAIEIDDTFSPGHFQRGLALSRMDRFQDAAASFEIAMQRGADAAQCLNETANLKLFLGDVPAAIKDIERSLEIQPDNPQAYFQLSRFVVAGEFAFNAAHLKTIDRLLKNPKLNQTDCNRLNVALAVHHERKENFTTAFEHFQSASDSIHSWHVANGLAFSESQRSKAVGDLKDFFQPDVFEKYSAFGNSSDQPIFIVGMPRSGTTLVQQMLARHPAIVGGGELKIIDDLIQRSFGGTTETNLRDAFESTGREWIDSTAKSYLQQIENIARTKVADLDLVDSSNPIHVVDKMPGNYLHVGFIRLLFPNAAIINCQRDPRDVCLSCFCQSFDSPRLQMETSNWNYLVTIYRHYAQLMEHWLCVTPGRIYQIVYENLVDDPQHQTARLLDFLNLEWHPGCLEFHQGRTQVRTASGAQVRKPLYKTSRARWRNYEAQMRHVTQELAREIDAFEAIKTHTMSRD